MPDLVTSDGVRLHYSRSGARDSPPLLVLHGLGSDSSADRLLADAIGDRLHVVRLDLRGHGRSEPLADPTRYGWFDRAVADVVELLDVLAWPDATVVGGSLGAAVTTATVLAHPERVTRVGLVAPALGAGRGFDNPVVIGFLQGVQQHGLVGLLDQLVTAMPDLLAPDVLADVRANYGRQDDAAMRACCAALEPAVLVDDLDRLRAIAQPTLVVGRRGDALHPFEMAEEHARRIPNARLLADDDAEPLHLRPHALADLLLELASEDDEGEEAGVRSRRLAASPRTASDPKPDPAA